MRVSDHAQTHPPRRHANETHAPTYSFSSFSIKSWRIVSYGVPNGYTFGSFALFLDQDVPSTFARHVRRNRLAAWFDVHDVLHAPWQLHLLSNAERFHLQHVAGASAHASRHVQRFVHATNAGSHLEPMVAECGVRFHAAVLVRRTHHGEPHRDGRARSRATQLPTTRVERRWDAFDTCTNRCHATRGERMEPRQTNVMGVAGAIDAQPQRHERTETTMPFLEDGRWNDGTTDAALRKSLLPQCRRCTLCMGNLHNRKGNLRSKRLHCRPQERLRVARLIRLLVASEYGWRLLTCPLGDPGIAFDRVHSTISRVGILFHGVQ